MAITFPLTAPTAVFRNCKISAMSSVGVARSPFTFQSQAQVNDGQMWSLSASWATMTRREAQPIIAFLTALNGREGTFLAGDPYHKNPLGKVLGTPVVDGASQSGKVLAVKGFDVSTSGLLLAGDYIGLGSGASTFLHMVLEDVASDGAGKADISIWPGLRSAPVDEAAINTVGCKAVFRLKSNQRDFERQLISYGLTIEAEEVVP